MKYAFSALVTSEFEGLDLQCEADELIRVDVGDGVVQDICPFTQGEDFLETLNIEE
jgi:hypothetical protein